MCHHNCSFLPHSIVIFTQDALALQCEGQYLLLSVYGTSSWRQAQQAEPLHDLAQGKIAASMQHSWPDSSWLLWNSAATPPATVHSIELDSEI